MIIEIIVVEIYTNSRLTPCSFSKAVFFILKPKTPSNKLSFANCWYLCLDIVRVEWRLWGRCGVMHATDKHSDRAKARHIIVSRSVYMHSISWGGPSYDLSASLRRLPHPTRRVISGVMVMCLSVRSTEARVHRGLAARP